MKLEKTEFIGLHVMHDGMLGYEAQSGEWVPFLPVRDQTYPRDQLHALFEKGDKDFVFPISIIEGFLMDPDLPAERRDAYTKACKAATYFMSEAKPIPSLGR